VPSPASSHPLRIATKAAALFFAANVLFALLDPLPMLGRLTLYNWLVPGRARLPYGEQPERAYNLSLNNLDAMFAAHRLNTPKFSDEFRVVILGDSSVWGILLKPDQTLDAALNALNVQVAGAGGKQARFYNLGYPVQSLTKDVLLLDEAVRRPPNQRPDLIVWLVTLEAFAPSQQLASMLVRSNPDRVRDLAQAFALPLAAESDASRLITPTFWERTLIGQRRALADWARLQAYAPLWGVTGIDQVYPTAYKPRLSDFAPADFGGDLTAWRGFTPGAPFSAGDATEDGLVFSVLTTGVRRAHPAPIVIVNEPIFVSAGQNSEVRYNFFYPRWAYDRYRALLAEVSAAQGWRLIDMWDAVPPEEFTDSPVHLTPRGSALLAERIAAQLARVSEGRARFPSTPVRAGERAGFYFLPTSPSCPLAAFGQPLCFDGEFRLLKGEGVSAHQLN
jgi:hypothetical protein